MIWLAAGAGFALGLVTGFALLTELLFPSRFWRIFTTSPKGK